MITGLVLIVLAVVLFMIGAYVISKSFRPVSATVELSPGENVTIGAASPGKALTTYYMDSINKSLEVNTTEPGLIENLYTSGRYVVIYTITNGTGTLYLVNNYTVPVTVEYNVVSLSIYSSIASGFLVIISIIIGIIGVILAILGAVLKPKT